MWETYKEAVSGLLCLHDANSCTWNMAMMFQWILVPDIQVVCKFFVFFKMCLYNGIYF